MSSRASVASARTPASARSTNVFVPQPQETPLNQAALLALDNLKRQDNAGLQTTLKRAAELLNGVVNDVNERAFEDRQRRKNRLDKLQEKGEHETDAAKQEYEEFQQKATALTNQMDESIRKVVDDQMWCEEVGDSIKHIITKSKDLQTRARQRNCTDEEDDQEDEDQVPRIEVDPAESSTALLHAAQTTAETRWNAQTLTERYSQHPTYEEYYKMKHYAQHSSENPPPLPYPSMWFAVQGGRNTQRTISGTQRGTQRSADDDEMQDDSDQQAMEDDTEIQVSSENRSCKCPLTFVWFENPVTSTKCPHSFEKSAILEVIRASNEHIPLSPEQLEDLNSRFPRGAKGRPAAEASMRMRQPKFTGCPQQGCNMQLTERDLRDDAVLKKQTERAKERARREKEREEAEDDDEEDSDDDIIPTQRKKKRQVYAIGSSPAGERRRTLIKPERAVSVVPNSQSQVGSSGGRGGFMDVGDADEEEGEDEDDDDDEEMEES